MFSSCVCLVLFCLRQLISWSSHDELISSSLSPPFPSTSSSLHSSSISCSPSCTSSTTLRAVETLRTPPKKKMDSLDDSYLLTGYEPNAYDLKETYVESYTESLTYPQWSTMTPHSRICFITHTEYMSITLSEKACLSVSRRPCPERTGRSVGEPTGRLVRPSGQELNVANAQIRTLLDRQKEQILAECQATIKKHKFQANYDRRSVRKLSEILESLQEERHCLQAEEFQRRDQQLLHERLLQQNPNYVKLIF